MVFDAAAGTDLIFRHCRKQVAALGVTHVHAQVLDWRAVALLQQQWWSTKNSYMFQVVFQQYKHTK